MFYCFIHFLFCSSTTQPTLYIVHVLQIPVLRISVMRSFLRQSEVFNTPRFTSLRFAQFTFESPRFTFPHFGIIQVLDIKFMFCNVQALQFYVSATSCFTLSTFYTVNIFQILFYTFLVLQSHHTAHVIHFACPGCFLRSMFYKSILYKFTFCTVFRVTRFYVSTLRHSPCFGHKVYDLQRPRFLSSFFIRLLHNPCFTNPRFTNLRYTTSFFVNRSLQHSTFYEPTFCTVHFRVTTFCVSTLRHNPCFGHKVHVLQRPRFLSSLEVCAT